MKSPEMIERLKGLRAFCKSQEKYYSKPDKDPGARKHWESTTLALSGAIEFIERELKRQHEEDDVIFYPCP